MEWTSTWLVFPDGAQTTLWHHPWAPQAVIRDLYQQTAASYAKSGMVAPGYMLLEAARVEQVVFFFTT